MVPKPQIYFQASDPICRISGKHFNQLMTRYGSPVVILNLVKKRERRRKHESLLSDYLQSSVTYLNTFLHEENFLQYIHNIQSNHQIMRRGEANDNYLKCKINSCKKTILCKFSLAQLFTSSSKFQVS